MPIPKLVDNVLPEGVHDCTIAEIAAMFGRFQRSDRRIRLTEKLRAYLDTARQSGVVSAVVIDGSYVTAKDEPDDIDLIVVVPADWDFARELKPFEYNVVTRDGIRRMGYPFDPMLRAEGTASYEATLGFFLGVNPEKDIGLTTKVRKGVLRVTL